MYPYLNDAVLYTTSAGYRVFFARCNKEIVVTPLEEKILSLCTGVYTEKEIIQLLRKDLKCTMEKAQKVYQDIKTKFLQEKILRFSKTKKEYSVFRSRLDPPFETAYIALTYKGRLPGDHCNNGKNQEELYVSEWKDAIQELVDCGCLRLFLTGGEPLLYKGVYDIIRYARSKVLAVGIITNGTLLDTDTINNMVKCGVCSLHFRVEGFTAATHDGYKDTESFKKVITAIKTAVKTAITVKVTLLVNKNTLKRGNDFIALMKSLGVTDYDFKPVMESFKDDGVSITPDEYKIFCEGLPLLPEKNTENTHTYKMHRIDYTACLIHPDGTVGLCPPFGTTETVIGDLITENFVEIWNSSLFKELRDVDAFIHETCVKCPYVAYCLGECMVKMYYMTGEITYGSWCGRSRICTF
ncbi:MAG: radical SAM protein [Candidatus Methanofastidiosia archaeon]|jgi:radical SAM protein with 4Fe4S-binding SPASM domain